MKARSIFIAVCAALLPGGVAAGEFVPGHVFVALPAGHLCVGDFGPDQIWEIDPETGDAHPFVVLPCEEPRRALNGLAFTPDGSRLRVSAVRTSEILEFDSTGNMTVALDAGDGIACPLSANPLAYDAAGNFYVLNCTGQVLRFPAEGGPATVFADVADGVGEGNSIAFASDGDLYYAKGGAGLTEAGQQILRFTPDGTASLFDEFGPFIEPLSLAADRIGNVFVVLGTGTIYRYHAGIPASREFWASLTSASSMVMSADQSLIYVHRHPHQLFGVSPANGSVTLLADFRDQVQTAVGSAGIAVVPFPPEPPPKVPMLPGWGVLITALLLLVAATHVFRRAAPHVGGHNAELHSRASASSFVALLPIRLQVGTME